MARPKPPKIKPILTSAFADDNNQEVLIEVYDEHNPPKGRGDNHRYSLMTKISKITDRVLDDLLNSTHNKDYLNKPSAFALKCVEWGFIDVDQDITKKSSYRKNVYEGVKLELKALFNAIDNQPEKERTPLARQTHKALNRLYEKKYDLLPK